MDNQNLIRQQSPSKLSKSEDWHNDFIARVAKGELTIGDLKASPVEARLNAFPIIRSNQILVVAALSKTVTDCFTYFNTSCDAGLVEMVVGDIMEVYSQYSVHEMVKALNQGRRMGGDLYGRLSGKHIMGWIAAYESETMVKLAEYRRNERFSAEQAWEGIELPEEMTKGLKTIISEDKPEPTNKEKAEALRQVLNVSDEERARRDHMNAWSYEKSGMTLESWMKDYESKKKFSNI